MAKEPQPQTPAPKPAPTKPPPKPPPPDPREAHKLTHEVETGVLAALKPAEGTEAPEGAQAGLFDRLGSGKLREIVKAVIPGLVKGAVLAGMDGSVTPDELIALATEAVRKLMELGAAGAPAAQAPIRPTPA